MFSILLTKFKTWWIAIAAGAFSVLLIVLRVLLGQNSKLRSKAEKATAKAKFAHTVMEQDTKAEVEEDSRLVDLKKELNEHKKSSELENPNDW